MMSLNRYRLRHLKRKGDLKAQRVARLLERPDRLLGVILLGNTFANILASAIATLIAVHYFGDIGLLIATLALTFIILIFAETAPKTLAALYPGKVAYPVSKPLEILLKIFYPLVWLINLIANGLLWLFRIKIKARGLEPLSREELRTVVHEATGKIASTYQQMLLRILDLEQVTVEDVMIPRNDIHGIDLEEDWANIVKQLTQCEHAYVPLYRENIDQVTGMLNLRKVMVAMQRNELSHPSLEELADKVYFVPEGALLNQQLLNFQDLQKSIGLVVDEYGDIQGLVTLQDVLEEIVGEFATGGVEKTGLIKKQKDGSVLLDGSLNIRDINRLMQWHLPTDGPKTLSGLIIEYFEMIPTSGVCCQIDGYPMEIINMQANTVKLVRIFKKQM